MQSQQKKVKWSRGETADALEERTDTGITEVSVSKLENIIADVYGNISRRPAFKIIESITGATDLPMIETYNPFDEAVTFAHAPQTFVFTIDANTYIIFIAEPTARGGFGGLLIQNNKFIRKIGITNNTSYSAMAWNWNNPISAAQYNNFMVVSHLYTKDVILQLSGTNLSNYAIDVNDFQFDAPWYAPYGTQTENINQNAIPGLEFNKDNAGFAGYTYTDQISGITTAYNKIDTGLTGTSISVISKKIPVGSIVQFPNIGAYMRVEGYNFDPTETIFRPETTFDSAVSGESTQPTSTGLCIKAYSKTHWGWSPTTHQALPFSAIAVEIYNDGVLIDSTYQSSNQAMIIKCSAFTDGYAKFTFSFVLPDHPWVNYIPAGKIYMYGPLLTPVAKEDGKDTTVAVETGYVSLSAYQPTQFTFHNQRLFAGGFVSDVYSPNLIPAYAVGSQIGRYNDFKNDYNTQSEAIVIDVSTSYQEEIVAMLDYSGLKILTDSAEYAYTEQGVVKQSENGSLKNCKPIVFGSVCLYADKSGGQIRALQYELQSNLFESSSINQMTQHDLIFNTTSMGGFYDKEHYTGHFLFATQLKYPELQYYNFGNPTHDHCLAVCNLIPGNQAMIWSRWTCPDTEVTLNLHRKRHVIQGCIEVNNKIWFVVACGKRHTTLQTGEYAVPGYTIAELDYEDNMDFESTINSNTYTMRINSAYTMTIPTTTVSVFDGDEYKWDDTLDANGDFTKSIAGLTNPHVGFMINATLESHPIDIQGKTYTEKKRIGKCVAVTRDTEPNAFTICDKTGYMSNDKKSVNFYGCTGMKDLVRYTIKNIKGAKFTIESLTMIVEYGTLDS